MVADDKVLKALAAKGDAWYDEPIVELTLSYREMQALAVALETAKIIGESTGNPEIALRIADLAVKCANAIRAAGLAG